MRCYQQVADYFGLQRRWEELLGEVRDVCESNAMCYFARPDPMFHESDAFGSFLGGAITDE